MDPIGNNTPGWAGSLEGEYVFTVFHLRLSKVQIHVFKTERRAVWVVNTQLLLTILTITYCTNYYSSVSRQQNSCWRPISMPQVSRFTWHTRGTSALRGGNMSGTGRGCRRGRFGFGRGTVGRRRVRIGSGLGYYLTKLICIGILYLLCTWSLNTCVFTCIQFERWEKCKYTYSQAYPRVFPIGSARTLTGYGSPTTTAEPTEVRALTGYQSPPQELTG